MSMYFLNLYKFQPTKQQLCSKPDVLLNTPIGMAAANGQLDVVRLLMKDRRVDAHDFGEYALREAIQGGHQRVAEVLVMDSTIGWAIGYAQSQHKEGRTDKAMVDYLIELENTRKHRLAVDVDLTGDLQLLNKGLKKVASKKHKKKLKVKKTSTTSGAGKSDDKPGGNANAKSGERSKSASKSKTKSKSKAKSSSSKQTTKVTG
jgi:hypothetical protein